MSGLLLITGFLGAGKTTLIRELIRLYSGKRLFLIVNEFGKAGVDGALLAGAGAALEEIDSGSIFCACRMPQFEAALERAAAQQPDIILVEASGLSDPTALHASLSRLPDIRYLGCVGIADALSVHKILSTSLVSQKQLAFCDLILIRKTDIASKERLASVLQLLTERYPDKPVRLSPPGSIDPNWIAALPSGALPAAWDTARDIALQRACVALRPCADSAQVTAFIRMFCKDSHRIKGIVTLRDGNFFIDCVGEQVSVTPYMGTPPISAHCFTALAGAGMPLRKGLTDAAKRCAEWVESIDWT